jgi:hypothetical protein
MAQAIVKHRADMEKGVDVMARFRSEMLDTFKGQKQALAAAGKTFGVAFGTPLAKAIKPAIEGLVILITKISEAFYELDPAFQQGIAVGLWLSAFTLIVTGAVIAIAGLLALIAATGLGLGSLALIVGGIVGGIGQLTLFLGALWVAWKNNTLGIKDSVIPVFERLYYGTKALIEIIRNLDDEWTYMTKDTSDNLDALGMGDFKRFVFIIGMYAHRLQIMLEGIKEGFKMAMIGAEDFFTPLKDVAIWTLEQLAKALEAVFGDLGLQTGMLKKDTKGWKDWGIIIGDVLAMLVYAIGAVLYVLHPFIAAIGVTAAAIAFLVKWWRELTVVALIANPFTAWLAPIAAIILLWDQMKYMISVGMDWIFEKMLPIAKFLDKLSDKYESIRGKPLFEGSFTRDIERAREDLGETLDKGWGSRWEGTTEEKAGLRIGKPGTTPQALPKRFIAAPPKPVAYEGPEISRDIVGETSPFIVQVFVDGQKVQESLDKGQKRAIASAGGNVPRTSMLESTREAMAQYFGR